MNRQSGETCIICGQSGSAPLVRPCECGPVHSDCAAAAAPNLVCRTCGNTYATRSVDRDETFQLLKWLAAALLFLFGATIVISVFAALMYFSVFMFGKASVIVFLAVFILSGFALAFWLVYRISKAEKTRRVVVDVVDAADFVVLEIDADA